MAKINKRLSCLQFISIQLTQLINTHLRLGQKRSRNLVAAIWEVITTSCLHTLAGWMPLAQQSYRRGNTCTHLSHSSSHASISVSVNKKNICVKKFDWSPWAEQCQEGDDLQSESYSKQPRMKQHLKPTAVIYGQVHIRTLCIWIADQ